MDDEEGSFRSESDDSSPKTFSRKKRENHDTPVEDVIKWNHPAHHAFKRQKRFGQSICCHNSGGSLEVLRLCRVTTCATCEPVRKEANKRKHHLVAKCMATMCI